MSRKILYNAVAVALGVAVGVALSIKPWQAYHDQRIKADDAISRAAEMQRRQSELAREKALLNTPLGKEKQAREKGFVRPGETPVDKP